VAVPLYRLPEFALNQYAASVFGPNRNLKVVAVVDAAVTVTSKRICNKYPAVHTTTHPDAMALTVESRKMAAVIATPVLASTTGINASTHNLLLALWGVIETVMTSAPSVFWGIVLSTGITVEVEPDVVSDV
jgi:hypothetical protein